jgi:hypothetical protein
MKGKLIVSLDLPSNGKDLSYTIMLSRRQANKQGMGRHIQAERSVKRCFFKAGSG